MFGEVLRQAELIEVANESLLQLLPSEQLASVQEPIEEPSVTAQACQGAASAAPNPTMH
jgi:hypothetical protein